MNEIYMITEDSWFPYKQQTINVNCPKILLMQAQGCDVMLLPCDSRTSGWRASRTRELIFPFYLAFLRLHLEHCSWFGVPEDSRSQVGSQGRTVRGWNTKFLGELGQFSLQKAEEGCNQCYTASRKGYRAWSQIPPKAHGEKTRSCKHKLQQEKFQLDIRK